MKRKLVYVPTYTQLDLMLASPTEPMPEAKRTHQLTRMWGGLAAIERGAAPSADDWRVCSDAVNLMETLVTHNNGWWRISRDEWVQVKDDSGLLPDAVQALALAGRRHLAGSAIRLDAAGIQSVRAVLEEYAELLEWMPERNMVQVHRLTETRIREIHQGRKRPHDVEVMAL